MKDSTTAGAAELKEVSKKISAIVDSAYKKMGDEIQAKLDEAFGPDGILRDDMSNEDEMTLRLKLWDEAKLGDYDKEVYALLAEHPHVDKFELGTSYGSTISWASDRCWERFFQR